jgi:hypothetical protein
VPLLPFKSPALRRCIRIMQRALYVLPMILPAFRKKKVNNSPPRRDRCSPATRPPKDAPKNLAAPQPRLPLILLSSTNLNISRPIHYFHERIFSIRPRASEIPSPVQLYFWIIFSRSFFVCLTLASFATLSRCEICLLGRINQSFL